MSRRCGGSSATPTGSRPCVASASGSAREPPLPARIPGHRRRRARGADRAPRRPARPHRAQHAADARRAGRDDPGVGRPGGAAESEPQGARGRREHRVPLPAGHRRARGRRRPPRGRGHRYHSARDRCRAVCLTSRDRGCAARRYRRRHAPVADAGHQPPLRRRPGRARRQPRSGSDHVPDFDRRRPHPPLLARAGRRRGGRARGGGGHRCAGGGVRDSPAAPARGGRGRGRPWRPLRSRARGRGAAGGQLPRCRLQRHRLAARAARPVAGRVRRRRVAPAPNAANRAAAPAGR